jgi:hypothetical protein
MHRRYLLFVIAIFVLASCKKDKYISPVIPAPVIPTVFLKDVVIPRLPSPYYHFEYDATGKVSFVSFASDFTRYDVIYNGDRISEMRNNILVNKDRLQYSYDNAGRVNNITYADSMGIVYTRLDLSYDEKKLIKIGRERKTTAGFVFDKTLSMSYYPDGNLMELTYHYLAFNGQTDAVFTDRFEQYDNKINVDGFGLVHNEFFDHLVLLPGVQLQKNNPGRESRTGNAQQYTVDYSYTYNNENLPLTKKGNLMLLTGTGAGQQVETNSVFSYY